MMRPISANRAALQGSICRTLNIRRSGLHHTFQHRDRPVCKLCTETLFPAATGKTWPTTSPLVQTAGPAAQLTLAQLRDLGVRRISTGSALARAAFTALHHAANDMLNKGSVAYAGVALSGEVWDGVKGLLIVLKPTPR